jgi:hypothetical protein
MTKQHQLYIHRNIANVVIHGEGLDGWDMDAFLHPEIVHPNIRFVKSGRNYGNYGDKKKMYSPLNILYQGETWGKFDWKKLRISELDDTGDQSERIAEFMDYLNNLAGGYFGYTLEYRKVEVCCFFDRKYRRKALGLVRLADEHYSLNGSEKRQDTAYNGVSEVFLSGELQTDKTDPKFRLKLYEAVRVRPVGFKDGQAPKLEIQIECSDSTLEAAKAFGVRKLLAILNYCNVETVAAEGVAIDHAGVTSYGLVQTEGIEGQDNRFIDELLVYETYANDPEWLQHSLYLEFFLPIYINGRRSRQGLMDSGISRYSIEKAVQSGLLLVSGGRGAGGVSYRVNFLYNTPTK